MLRVKKEYLYENIFKSLGYTADRKYYSKEITIEEKDIYAYVVVDKYNGNIYINVDNDNSCKEIEEYRGQDQYDFPLTRYVDCYCCVDLLLDIDCLFDLFEKGMVERV